ncbi:Ribosomal RNA-processing protein 7A [Sesamum alatum]|uniref:Ribosomal RNA-processing protein 7A n=1 Tax=Sesamum alatum TaxID=300844 RepID=A0AAE2CL86_9LAMI|nr:Ribosomal RNA-processing protein 7A [Sesamum alatum]
MGAEDSLKKLKRKKNTKRKGEEELENGSSQLAKKKGNVCRATEENKKNKSKEKKKKPSVDIADKDDAEMFGLPNDTADETEETHEINRGNKKSTKLRKNKRKNGEITRRRIEEFDTPQSNEVEDSISGEKDVQNEPAEEKLQKSRKKKKRNVEGINRGDHLNEKDDVSEQQNEEMAGKTESKPQHHIANSQGLNKVDTSRRSKKGKSKKPGKIEKKKQFVANELSSDNLLEKRGEDAEDEVYQMSSGDEDYSKGMRKWITRYHQSRPGLKLLQEKIDDFIMAHEAREEQARVEREAQAAEGGWTVVVHHKGRKKTTDAESGIAVGSVAQAAVLDKMAQKKKKEVGLDFYRFQKREAHRNEIMMLQSKFEQDKKRIQQLRAARKFRPY